MKHKNITFSIPEDLKAMLYAYTNRRGLSRFISEAIRRALEEEKFAKEKELDAAYEAANQDPSRLKTLENWNVIDDINDLNTDEDWDWLHDQMKN